MTTPASEKGMQVHSFLLYLESLQKDLGALADLRCALIPGLESRSWQYLTRYCNLLDPEQRAVFSTVAAAYGILPSRSEGAGNMGELLRKIAQGAGGRDGLKSFELRFRRLIGCGSVVELSAQLHGIFKTAKQCGYPIDHNQLLWDLLCWQKDDSQVKLRWARSYWAASGKKGAETPDESGE